MIGEPQGAPVERQLAPLRGPLGWAVEDVLLAARAATEFAAGAPLRFGGDLNLRPRQNPEVFEMLAAEFGLGEPTEPTAIDHLLARELTVLARPARWDPERREISQDGLSLRLSDHAPDEARFETPAAR